MFQHVFWAENSLQGGMKKNWQKSDGSKWCKKCILMRQKNISLTGETQKQCLCGPKKSLAEKFGKKVAVVSKAKGAVLCGGLPCVLQRGPTSPLIPLTISGHFTHTTISHSPTHPTIPCCWPGLPPVPLGGSTTPPGPPTPLLTWGPAGGVERRNISKMWHCLLSGCLGWLTDWPGGAHNERACRAAAYCHRVIHIWLSGKTKFC